MFILLLALTQNPIADLETLEGSWVMVRTQGGKEPKQETILRIKGEDFTLLQGGKEEFKGKLALNGKTISFQAGGEEILRATWNLEGDSLSLKVEDCGPVVYKRRK